MSEDWLVWKVVALLTIAEVGGQSIVSYKGSLGWKESWK